MEKILIILAFIVIRWLLSGNKEKKKRKKAPTPPSSKPKKSVEDIFGDFMDEVNKKTKPEPVFTKNDDNHKAEDDSDKKLDWQEVTYSKFGKKKEELLEDNYRKLKTRIPEVKIDPLEVVIEDSNETIIDEIDLRKAVIYKEILERKYFSI